MTSNEEPSAVGIRTEMQHCSEILYHCKIKEIIWLLSRGHLEPVSTCCLALGIKNINIIRPSTLFFFIISSLAGRLVYCTCFRLMGKLEKIHPDTGGTYKLHRKVPLLVMESGIFLLLHDCKFDHLHHNFRTTPIIL